MAHLHQAQLQSVLLEAGTALNGAFLDQQLVDEVALFYAPVELGAASIPFASGGLSPFALEQALVRVDKRSFGVDVCVGGLLHDPWPEASLVS